MTYECLILGFGRSRSDLENCASGLGVSRYRLENLRWYLNFKFELGFFTLLDLFIRRRFFDFVDLAFDDFELAVVVHAYLADLLLNGKRFVFEAKVLDRIFH